MCYYLLMICACSSVVTAGGLTSVGHAIRGRDYGSIYDPPPSDVLPGYNYPLPIPNPPPQFDQPATPSVPSGLYEPPNHQPNKSSPFPNDPMYLPPVYPPLDSPPQFDPIPVNPPQNHYLPPTPPSTLYGVPNFDNHPNRLRVLNMSCLDATSGRFFKSVIRTSRFAESPPVIDNSQSDCISGSGDTFRIDVTGNQMARCGIRYCSGDDRPNLCVPLRLPTVRGLRLPEDDLITLQCRPQERVVSHTKRLRVHPQIVQGRAAAAVATGGSQRDFDTQVGLFRRAPGGGAEFSQIVAPGSAVQLGEDLLLRAAVRDGDGKANASN